ncbi:MAG: hypothetical protein GC181_10650 [Bacteroidetes bacterium]|nr:hypothetical protein [Bacteroidota bacterium]
MIESRIAKKVHLNLAGQDGNAFHLLGLFQNTARSQGWTQQEIQIVISQAQEGDYTHLLAVLELYCSPDSNELL